jgi:hypothetical protein
LEFDRPRRFREYVQVMPSDRRYRAVVWLLNRVRVPAVIGSRLLGWALGSKHVPYTAAQIVEQDVAEAERSASD